MPTVHLIIQGKVQGVFFRATAKEVADEIGITGWVRNTEEGNVEIMANGDEERLQRFIEWCKVGPKRAFVTNVRVRDLEDQKFKNFQVMRSG